MERSWKFPFFYEGLGVHSKERLSTSLPLWCAQPLRRGLLLQGEREQPNVLGHHGGVPGWMG